jgi:hypothetical protein
LNQIVTVLRSLLRAVLAVARGAVRLVLNLIDNRRISRGVGPMDHRQRRTARWMIGFGFGVFVLAVMAGMSSGPKPAVAATPAARPYVVSTTTPRATPTLTPSPTPEPLETIVPTTAPSDTEVDVDVPHVNMPDGALTGGYCRHKWWC